MLLVALCEVWNAALGIMYYNDYICAQPPFSRTNKTCNYSLLTIHGQFIRAYVETVNLGTVYMTANKRKDCPRSNLGAKFHIATRLANPSATMLLLQTILPVLLTFISPTSATHLPFHPAQTLLSRPPSAYSATTAVDSSVFRPQDL